MKIESTKEEKQWTSLVKLLTEDANVDQYTYAQYSVLYHPKDLEYAGIVTKQGNISAKEARMTAGATGIFQNLIHGYNDRCRGNGSRANAKGFQRYLGRTHDNVSGRLEVQLERTFDLGPTYVLSDKLAYNAIRWCSSKTFELADVYLVMYLWSEDFAHVHNVKVVNLEQSMKRYLV